MDEKEEKNNEQNQEKFRKYEDENASKKILLAKLIAYGYSFSEIEKITREKEEFDLGAYAVKLYAFTKENIDFNEIDNDFKNTFVPQIVSIDSFENSVTADTIYMYQPSEDNHRFFINDFGIISPVMVINPNCIVSTKKAVPVEEATQKGFMYFCVYVRDSKTTIDKWTFKYDDNTFEIIYQDNEEAKPLVLLHYVGISKKSTYKTVIFLLKKIGNSQQEVFPDNFRTSVLKIIEKY